MDKVKFAIHWLKIVYIWLGSLRDERDLQQARDKISEIIKKLES